MTTIGSRLLLLLVLAATASCHALTEANSTFFQLVCDAENEGCSTNSHRCQLHEFNFNACLPLESGRAAVAVVACYPQKFHHTEPHIVVRTYSEANCTGTFEDSNQIVGRCFHSASGEGQYVMNECSQGQLRGASRSNQLEKFKTMTSGSPAVSQQKFIFFLPSDDLK
jgi:hypothetical protein